MGAMERLLRKLGYVKLDKYGLYLTPDGRVVSTDGKPVEATDPGGYEVGAAARVAKPTGPITFPGRTAVAAPTESAPVPVSQPILQPVQSPPDFVPSLARVEAAAVVTQPPAPAEPVTDDEDEWEWQMAMARARAAADEVEAAATAAPAPVAARPRTPTPTPAPAPVRTLAPATPPPPREWVRPDATPIRAQAETPSAPIARPAAAAPSAPIARTPSAPIARPAAAAPSAPIARTPSAPIARPAPAAPSAPIARSPSGAVRTPITSDRGATASGTTQVRPAPTRPNDEVTRRVAYPAAPAGRTPISQRTTAARPIESPPNPLAPVVRSSPRPAPHTVARPAEPHVPPQAQRPVGEDTVRTTAVTDTTESVGDVTTQTTIHHRSVGDETTRTHAAPPPPSKKAASDGAQRPMATRTVIPVPQLPTLDQTQPALRLEPVVRSRPAAPPPMPAQARAAAPRRFPRGTDQVEPQAAAPPAPARIATAPANDSAPLPRVTKRFANS